MLKGQKEISREKYIYKIGLIGIISNIVLFIIKLGMGILTSSVSIIGDAFNSLTDVASAVISIIGTKLAQAPPNKEYPMGFGRYEYLSGLLISLIVSFLGFSFLKTSTVKIFSPEKLNIVPIVLILLVLSVLVKLYIYKINMKAYNDTKGPTLKATAVDARSDALMTTSILISIIVYKFTNINIDGIIGFIIAINIIKSGLELLTETANTLVGQAPSQEKINKIVSIIEGYEKSNSIHELIIHNYGVNKSIASVHVEMSSSLNVFEMHEILDDMEKRVKEECGIDIVIHADPLCEDKDEIEEALGELKKVINKLNSKFLKKKYITAEVENFRVVGRGKKKNLVFDLVLVFEANSSFDKKKEKEKNKIKSKLSEHILKELNVNNPEYNCSMQYIYKIK